ncbi:polysaccharide pyruvyl transferase family protein [Agreia sp.]|uniref:polysaccharide pyruvyl transferase family protein n=1 Tax=Agreia sp. TaxID=1872416 RepID=UPI0035BBD2B5
MRRPVNNFGDLLGPMIVNRILELNDISGVVSHDESRRLVAVGSILRMARDGDVVWGTGANGKSLDGVYDFSTLDVRAVRGPLTAEFLAGLGISSPAVYGDPGLLVGTLWGPEFWKDDLPAREITVIPNLNDSAALAQDPRYVSPRSEVTEVIRSIARSSFVTGSSLHAIVVAESFGIPARLIKAQKEPDFKYRDYYLGTGRTNFQAAGSVEEAVEMGGEQPPVWSSEPLLKAFPFDLWGADAGANVA